uniref:Uncharacterized protein n=1 Tax=Spongospora subterranea TaxID=70186 RepID=A0A0H5QKE5_9EUKA|eukprot:CRZ02473.1 hypothetical protein [Spongospora subterranea]
MWSRSPTPSLLVLVAVIALGSGAGLVVVNERGASQTYNTSYLTTIGLAPITELRKPDGGTCPSGAKEITVVGCAQGEGRLWNSRLCAGAQDTFNSKCRSECDHWVLKQATSNLQPVAKRSQCYIPEGGVGDEGSATAKCPKKELDARGGKCKCWACLVKVVD